MPGVAGVTRSTSAAGSAFLYGCDRLNLCPLAAGRSFERRDAVLKDTRDPRGRGARKRDNVPLSRSANKVTLVAVLDRRIAQIDVHDAALEADDHDAIAITEWLIGQDQDPGQHICTKLIRASCRTLPCAVPALAIPGWLLMIATAAKGGNKRFNRPV